MRSPNFIIVHGNKTGLHSEKVNFTNLVNSKEKIVAQQYNGLENPLINYS